MLKLERIPDNFSQQKKNQLENQAFHVPSFLRFYNVCDMFTGVNLLAQVKHVIRAPWRPTTPCCVFPRTKMVIKANIRSLHPKITNQEELGCYIMIIIIHSAREKNYRKSLIDCMTVEMLSKYMMNNHI